MSEREYNWQRFWSPRDGAIRLGGDGFLSDPSSQYGHILNPEAVPLEKLANVPCLALLGEPGSGKSRTLKRERTNITTRIEAEKGRVLWLDLGAFSDEGRLERKLFDSNEFVSWRNGTYNLHLFLDSLDECLLQLTTVTKLLLSELQDYPVKRLFLRVACRTAVWPKSFEDGLRQLWGREAVDVYELAPLRRVDVIEAAIATGLSPDAFLVEVVRMEVVPLAIRPITLDMLLDSYSRSGHLPSTQKDLYTDGCKRLAEEKSQVRHDTGLSGLLSGSQREIVAERIAAITVFANREVVWKGLGPAGHHEEDVSVEDLAGGTETAGYDQFVVGEAAIRETLSTGLFTSRGPERLGWAHRTYAEFLAARYLVYRKLTTTQIMSLLIHADEADERLVPQLYETAAWLSGMQADVFRAVMERDPVVLLRSDVATAEVPDRVALVETLLRLCEEERVLERDLRFSGGYAKLNHSRLAEQLRPYLVDSSKGEMARRVAIDIAEACELRALQNELADLALDTSNHNPLHIRINAAYAVVRISDDATKARLKPLATSQAGDDPDDELKGCGLLAVWPSHITADELFAAIVPPKRQVFAGSYQMFLHDRVAEHLQVSDLPRALVWVEAQPSRYNMPYAFRELVDAIMLQGWSNLEAPGVLKAFARASLSRLRHHEDIVESDAGHTL